MEGIRDEAELKHVCRLCNKRYPSGKSLGGHMRSHVMANSSYASSSSLLHKVKKKPKKHLHTIAGAGDGSNGYELRENPRKSWRVVVDTNTPAAIAKQEERVCKQCGKAFQSPKALCGHMSSHSQRERSFTRLKYDEEDEDDDDGDKSWTCEEEDEEDKELAIESHSSNGSGIEQEQEDVALCLMMLSRDSANRARFNFTAESSDNNSVVLEGGSSSNYAAKRKNLTPASDFNSIGANVSVKMDLAAAKKKLKFVELENSDSGYFENEAKEQESDDSVDGYAGNYGIKRPRVDGFGGTEWLYHTSGSNKVKIEDLSSTKSPPRKYQCSICERSFKSHQALGGHIITHRRDADPHSGKNSSARSDSRNADNKGLMGSKKAKGYCCPYCPKVFKSGQALGGHKRSHLIGSSSQEKASLIKSVEETPPKIHHRCRLLDLNLPAPVEEDGNGPNSGGHDQFMPW